MQRRDGKVLSPPTQQRSDNTARHREGKGQEKKKQDKRSSYKELPICHSEFYKSDAQEAIDSTFSSSSHGPPWDVSAFPCPVITSPRMSHHPKGHPNTCWWATPTIHAIFLLPTGPAVSQKLSQARTASLIQLNPLPTGMLCLLFPQRQGGPYSRSVHSSVRADLPYPTHAESPPSSPRTPPSRLPFCGKYPKSHPGRPLTGS